MKGIAPIVLASITVWFMTGLPIYASPTAATSDEEALRLQVERFSAAYERADVETLDSMLDANYVHMNEGSNRLNRNDWLDWNRHRYRQFRAGTLKLEQYDVSEIHLVFNGNVAIVTGRVRASGTRDGEKFSSDIRLLSVWINRDRIWKRAAFSDASVRE